MNNLFDNTERYGADLGKVPRMDDFVFETQSRGMSRIWFIPIILLGGLLTTVIVLGVNYIVNIYAGYNFFMYFINSIFLIWIFNFIIPIGAVLSGLLAGAGYTIVARFFHFCPKKSFIFFIFLLQFTMFFVAKYAEYTIYCYHIHRQMQLEQPVQILIDKNKKTVTFDQNEITNSLKTSVPSFIEFYRTSIEEAEWGGNYLNDKPFKMGKWAWIHEFFRLFFFVTCSIETSRSLMFMAYCQACQRFMSQKLEFTFSMRASRRKIKKDDETDLELFRQEETEAINYATEKITKIEDFLKTKQAINRSEIFKLLCKIRDEITANAKTMENVPNEIRVCYSECNSCDNFLLEVSIISHVNNDKEDKDNNENDDETIFKNIVLLRFIDGNFVMKNEIPMSTI
ncbi:MAG: hypothetical protein LBP87_13090 [Planctomycetaceae bacterium]|jgi:hypothetical protein|nr:hypothetical protein [Planctomycetaceae bacterium]